MCTAQEALPGTPRCGVTIPAAVPARSCGPRRSSRTDARSRRRAERDAFVQPAIGDHRNDLALARQIAVPDLSVHEVVVQAHDRNAIGGAVARRRWILEKRHAFEYPCRTRRHDRAFDRIDREEMRVRPRTRLAEEAAHRQAMTSGAR